ncbi:unnamed protein product [Closterium sp. Yama58-4]|nr:unnamed protein product [Closterium sp. Yama58-4]
MVQATAATCLLLPPLIIARLLAANVTAVYRCALVCFQSALCMMVQATAATCLLLPPLIIARLLAANVTAVYRCALVCFQSALCMMVQAAAATCLLLPPLIIARLLAANVTAVYRCALVCFQSALCMMVQAAAATCLLLPPLIIARLLAANVTAVYRYSAQCSQRVATATVLPFLPYVLLIRPPFSPHSSLILLSFSFPTALPLHLFFPSAPLTPPCALPSSQRHQLISYFLCCPLNLPAFSFPPLPTSDINSVWLRDARPYFLPAYSLVLPSLSNQVPPQQQQPAIAAVQGAQGEAENGPGEKGEKGESSKGGEGGGSREQQEAAAPAPANTTIALMPSLLGSLSPWLMALRPSPAVQAMVSRWALRALKGFKYAEAAEAASGSGVFSGSEILKRALNHTMAEMVREAGLVGAEELGLGEGPGWAGGIDAGTEEGAGDTGEGRRGASVGVLPEQLFPPGWKAVGDRAWLEAHRKEIVAVQVRCGEDSQVQEMCVRDMKLWLELNL